jgi:hypothetical protein
VDLHGNRIEDGGAEALAHALKNGSIESINLDKNWIKDAGAIKLAEVLIENPRFTELAVKNNRYGAAGTEALKKSRGEAAARTAAYEKKQRKLTRLRTREEGNRSCGHEDCTGDCTIA